MIILKSVNDVLELTTTTTADLDYSVTWVDVTTTTFSPNSSEGTIGSIATTTIVAAPLASTQRQIKLISIRNRHTTSSNTVTVKKDISATEYILTPTVTLSPGEVYQYTDGSGWQVLMSNGQVKVASSDMTGTTGRSSFLYKTSTGADAAGYWYCTSKDSGSPGAWSVGSGGTAGRACYGTNTTTDAGAIGFTNSVSGNIYLTDLTLSASVAHYNMIFDCLWVNNGLVITNTTASTVNSITLPPRDVNGTSDGEGCIIGALATAALGNAAVVNTPTISYTNSDGVSGRTASLTATIGNQFPATPVIGTIVWFNLYAGDRGVRSIQSITLNTTLTSGSLSLLIARPIVSAGTLVANTGTSVLNGSNPGIKLYSGSCLLHCYMASATTATVFAGTLTYMDRL